ncbi:hypothetical protein V2J09_020188 [Rumex salicifolius]
MAYRRSVSSIRSIFLARRLNPSFTCISHDNDHTNHQESQSSGSKFGICSTQNRSFGRYVNNASCQFTHTFRRTGCGLLGNRLNLNRFMSTATGERGKIGTSSEFVTTIADAPGAVEAVSEVADVYAGTPDLGAFALQHLWASIALTTLLIRGLSIPFLINELKAAGKFQLIKLEMKKKQLPVKGVEAKDVRDYKMNELCNQYGLNPRDPRGRIKGIFLEGYLISQSSLLGIYFMAKYVPSFENGGALWFTNLTTPDDTYIFAGLTAVTLLTSVLCTWQGTVTQTIRRFFATVILPWSLILPKAIFCYLLPTELFFLCLGLALRFGRVKKAFGIPDVPGAPHSGLDFLNRYRNRRTSESRRGDI